jgi:hypothetical protein
LTATVVREAHWIGGGAVEPNQRWQLLRIDTTPPEEPSLTWIQHIHVFAAAPDPLACDSPQEFGTRQDGTYAGSFLFYRGATDAAPPGGG